MSGRKTSSMWRTTDSAYLHPIVAVLSRVGCLLPSICSKYMKVAYPAVWPVRSNCAWHRQRQRAMLNEQLRNWRTGGWSVARTCQCSLNGRYSTSFPKSGPEPLQTVFNCKLTEIGAMLKLASAGPLNNKEGLCVPPAGAGSREISPAA